MSEIVRDGDIDIQQIRERVTPQDAQEALGLIEEAQFLLKGLRDHRGENEGAHAILRALSMVKYGLEDALDEDE